MNNKVAYQEENTGTSKYRFGRREYLPNRYQNEIFERLIDIHQTNPFGKCLRKCIQYVDRWVKPFVQSLVAAPGLFELVNLDLKYSQNGRGRVAWMELGGERMSGEILFSLFFICLEGFFKDDIETGRGCFRCGSLGGRARSRRLTHAEGIVVTWRMRSMTRLESRKALVSMSSLRVY